MSERDIFEIMRLLGTAIKGINRLEGAFTEFKAEVKSEFNEVKSDLNEVRSELNVVKTDGHNFRAEVNHRFDQVDKRLDKIEKRDKIGAEDLMQIRVTDLQFETRIKKIEKEAA